MTLDGSPLLDEELGSGKALGAFPRCAGKNRALVFMALTASLCFAGAANDVLSKSVANKYTQRFAFFVDQGNNVFYALFSFLPVLRLWLMGAIPEATRRCPQRKFAFMGLLDACGTYLSSVGAVHTPGQLQTVLSQALIPISMLASWALLEAKYSGQEIVSAAVVLTGACAAVLPVVINGGIAVGSGAWPPAIAVFALSNLPMAFSNVYKELGFADMELDVFCLTFAVVVYQTLLSFGLLLLQTVPYLSGSTEGLSLLTAWDDFIGGSACFLGISPDDGRGDVDCSGAGLLLVAYVAVNLGFNLIGLLLVKTGSDLRIGAVLCSLAFAVKMPVSTVLFSSPLIMGNQAEPLQASTWTGLFLVVVGFLWHVRAGQERASASERGASPEEDVAFEEPWAFHERVVGCVSTASVRTLRRNSDDCSIMQHYSSAEDSLRQPA